MIDGHFYPTEYDYVISTIPLGHLKAHAKHLFKPQLPGRKLEAIRAFGKSKWVIQIISCFSGFGSLLKVFLVYDRPFWDNTTSSFVPLHVDGCAPESYLSLDLHTFEVLSWKPNVLVGWLSGNGPHSIDSLTDEELAKHITKHFREAMVRSNWDKLIICFLA
jgi:monoamine oxidase